MHALSRLVASSTLALSLCLASLALAQTTVDISHDLITHPALLPNAAGEYGQALLVDRNIHGLLVGGFTFPTHALQEGSFSVMPPSSPGASPLVRLFTAGPDCTWTHVQAVNRHPAMVGWCYIRTATTETVEGFYRSESGRITRLRPPGARLSEAHGINDQHLVVGWYETGDGLIRGYRWNRSTNQYTTFDAPFPGVYGTVPLAITNAGHIGVTFLTPTGQGVGLLRNGQWTSLTAPGSGVGFSNFEDLGEDGRVLVLGSRANEPLQSFVWENGVVTRLTWPTRQVRFTHARALSGDLVIGHVDWDLPLPPDTPHTANDTIFQGFVAPLGALRGEVVGPPPAPQMVARSARFATTETARPDAARIETGGCPDEAPAPGTQRVGRLAMSWVGCARLR